MDLVHIDLIFCPIFFYAVGRSMVALRRPLEQELQRRQFAKPRHLFKDEERKRGDYNCQKKTNIKRFITCNHHHHHHRHHHNHHHHHHHHHHNHYHHHHHHHHDYHNDVPKRVPKRTEACFYFTISFVCPNHYVIVFGVQ